VNAQRARITDCVERVPGIHFNELVRELDLAPGQVQYHTKKLSRDGRIDRDPLYGRTHYYPPGCDEWERGALALCRRETARDVLTYLLDAGPAEPARVARALDIARSTLEWHLDRLVERDLVRKKRDTEGRVTLVLAKPAETAQVLGTVTPSVPERMTDRFTRLVDRLLDEDPIDGRTDG